MRTVVGLVLAMTALAALLTGCGRDQPPSAMIGTEVIAPEDREAAPTLSGSTLDGAPLDVADLRGQVVVLNSWASWCAPCEEEIPAFVALDTSATPDVHVVGLNVSDDPGSAQAFVRSLGMQYPSIVDAAGTILPTIPGVPPKSLPSTVIIDRDGRIAARIVGIASASDLWSIVGQVVDEDA